MAVYQSFTQKYLRMQIAEFGTTQLVVAEFAGIDNSQLSFFMNGHRGLSTKAQREIHRVFAFFEEVRDETDLPIDFTNVIALRPHWKQWCAAREEGEVVRTQGE